MIMAATPAPISARAISTINIVSAGAPVLARLAELLLLGSDEPEDPDEPDEADDPLADEPVVDAPEAEVFPVAVDVVLPLDAAAAVGRLDLEVVEVVLPVVVVVTAWLAKTMSADALGRWLPGGGPAMMLATVIEQFFDPAAPQFPDPIAPVSTLNWVEPAPPLIGKMSTWFASQYACCCAGVGAGAHSMATTVDAPVKLVRVIVTL